MGDYEQQAMKELLVWQRRMQRAPSFGAKFTRNMQVRINRIIPEKIHVALTRTIKEMVRVVLFGAKFTTRKPRKTGNLELREAVIKERIDFYKNTGAAEGGVTGAAGILASFADFPILLTMKFKMLFDIASLYGYDVKDYRERLYILHIFQLTFSSQQWRNEVYRQITEWDKQQLPEDIHAFNWRRFQQEYRDYIDLAKLAQMIPGIGAVVGLVVNFRLIRKLGDTAVQAYRMRWFREQLIHL